MYTVILFAMIAAFLALRLYSVLGKRTGHEQTPPRPAEERVAPLHPARTIDVTPEVRDAPPRGIESGAEPGLRQLVAADASFDVAQFLDGSKSAYRMILEAYWSGDEETLTWLVADDVRTGFMEAVEERREAGHVLENRLVTIEKATIIEALVEGDVSRITVRFDADIAAVTRDADGVMIAGSMSDAVETHDCWTFARMLRSDDPNWKLVETDEA